MKPLTQQRALYALLTVLCSLIAAGGLTWGAARAQNPTATPQLLIIPTLTATVPLFDSPTPSRTPTINVGIIRIEAKSEANVRTAPSLDSQVLAKIVPGRFYAAQGRFGKWIQIAFDRSVNGVAWVFEDVVNFSGGDPASLPEIDANAIPTPNVATAAAQSTAEFLTGTPGAPETATAARGSATGVFTRVAAPIGTRAPEGALPTFTYPPPLVEATLAPRSAAAFTGGGLPPIVPIVGLFTLAVFGFFISALRRGR